MWPFPQDETGGQLQLDELGAGAVDQLEALRAKGAQYVVLPMDQLWWLEHKATELQEHLENRYTGIFRDGAYCAVYKLGKARPRDERRPPSGVSPATGVTHDAARRSLEIPRFHETPERLNVIEEIHPDDDMYHAGLDAYFESGRSALRCIQLAMLAAGKTSITNALDFPSGFGRSLRTLTEAFPDATFTACDLTRAGVDFCARTFGATPIYSHTRSWPSLHRRHL